MGVASIFLFDANGALNMGLQKRPFLFTDRVPFSWDPAAPPSGRQPGEDGVWCGSGGSSVNGIGGERGGSLWGGDAEGGGGGGGFDGGVPSKKDWGFALERVRNCCFLFPSDFLVSISFAVLFVSVFHLPALAFEVVRHLCRHELRCACPISYYSTVRCV